MIATSTAGRTRAIADNLARLALVLAAVSATAGLLVPHLYRDTDAWIRQARAADLVTLFAVVPVLAFGLWRARMQSAGGRLTVLAALGYLAYNHGIFGFSVAINAMTPVHIAILGLSVWSLILGVVDLSRNPLGSDVGARLPRRTTGTFLLLVSALFGLIWLGQIAQTITSGVMPDELVKLGLSTNPVYTLDLAFGLPFLSLSGILLLQRRQAGAEIAVAALAWVALMGFGVLAIFAFDGLAGVPLQWPIVAFIGLISAVGVSLTALGLMPAHGDPSPVSVRAIRSTDAAELQRFYAGLSPESRRTRFLSISAGLSQAQSLSFCTTDHDHREGFVAIARDGSNGHERIVGHLCLEPDGADAAEVAIAVADEFQHNGIGRRLMAAGMAWARREHIARLTATSFADNVPIHRLLAGLGLSNEVTYAGAGVSEMTIDLVGQGVAA